MNLEAKNHLIPKRILICGLGSIGRRHARVLHQSWPGIELAALRSGHGTDSTELALMSQQFYDFNAALAWEPDAAVIASPAPFHQQQAVLLVRQGVPILIEKPVGVGSEPREAWVELLQHSRSTPIVIGYVLRHDPCAAYVKERLDSQELGKVLDADFYCGSWLPEWRPGFNYRESVSSRRTMGGGVLLELSHEIDLASWFLGKFEITFASLRQSGILDVDVEDQALLVGRGPECPLITIRLNFCSRPPRRRVVIRCEKGEINWNLLEGEVSTLIHHQEAQMFKSAFDGDERYRLQAEHFIACVCKGKAPHCSLHEGLQVLELINQARAKAISQGITLGV